MAKIKQGMRVLFYYNHSKKWLIKIAKNDHLHTHIGIISHKDAIGKEFGSRITTNKSKYVYLLEPTIYDHISKIQHGTQIVYPKDLGYIVSRTGIKTGQKIVEIGTGSGSLTSFVAGIVSPRGHVYTFDVDEDFMDIAKKNIEKMGTSKYITMEKLDIKKIKNDKVPVTEADVVLIDLGDPWSVIPQARKMLKGSGGVLSICPTMNQLEKLVTNLVKNEFTDIECVENIQRNIEAREGKTRHSFQGIGHTTYICYARKAFFEKT